MRLDSGKLLPDEGDDYGCETCGHDAHFSGPCICGCDDVPIEVARAAGPFMLCRDWRMNCPATAGGLEAGYCIGGYVVDGDDWLRCHGED